MKNTLFKISASLTGLAATVSILSISLAESLRTVAKSQSVAGILVTAAIGLFVIAIFYTKGES